VSDLAFVPDGLLHVGDADNSRIQVFDTGGRFVAMFGEAGTGKGNFIAPLDVAFDTKGHVYVVDIEANRILKFRLLPPLAP
jgi:DNA-binding beta-propeller fold protein YncE